MLQTAGHAMVQGGHTQLKESSSSPLLYIVHELTDIYVNVAVTDRVWNIHYTDK